MTTFCGQAMMATMRQMGLDMYPLPIYFIHKKVKSGYTSDKDNYKTVTWCWSILMIKKAKQWSKRKSAFSEGAKPGGLGQVANRIPRSHMQYAGSSTASLLVQTVLPTERQVQRSSQWQ
jgi:hypothetical protein